MEPEMIKVPTQDFKKLMADVEMIKAILFSHKPGPDPEGELSDWTKNELEEARKIPDSENVSLEKIEQAFLKHEL